MSCDASDGGESKVGDAGLPVLVDQNVRLRKWFGYKCGGILFGNKETYSFQISVDHAEVVHVLHAIRNAGQLNGSISKALAGSNDNAQAQHDLHGCPS